MQHGRAPIFCSFLGDTECKFAVFSPIETFYLYRAYANSLERRDLRFIAVGLSIDVDTNKHDTDDETEQSPSGKTRNVS